MQVRRTSMRVPRLWTLLFWVLVFWAVPVRATNVSGNCPAGGFTAAGSPWNFTGNVSVLAGTTCTVEAGATLNGNGNGLSVSGTLNAAGTSTANRDVVFNNVYVTFQPTATGTLQFCTVNQSPSGAYITVQGAAQTVTSCTIAGNGSYAIYVPGGAPTVSNSTISGTISYTVFVGGGTPLISGNTITANSIAIYQGGGAGTLSGDTIGFSGGSNRTGIYIISSATPTVSGNTILDDTNVNDIGISAQGTAPGVQIINNTLNASGGDVPLQITPALFQPGSQVSGNSFPGGLAAGVALTGSMTGTATIVSTYLVQNLSVPPAATLTIAAGITLSGGNSSGQISVSGTLNAVGTSTANRDVVFNNVYVTFQSTATGTLQFCTASNLGHRAATSASSTTRAA